MEVKQNVTGEELDSEEGGLEDLSMVVEEGTDELEEEILAGSQGK